MSELENVDIPSWEHQCVVCGKSVDHGGGMAHFKVGGRMIAICCPLCVETFNQDSRHYLELRKAREIATQLRQQKG